MFTPSVSIDAFGSVVLPVMQILDVNGVIKINVFHPSVNAIVKIDVRCECILSWFLKIKKLYIVAKVYHTVYDRQFLDSVSCWATE